MAGITLNPVQVTNFPGSFFAQSTGYVQGVLLDDPVTRFKLNQGMWNVSTSPVWGGMGVTVNTANPATEVQEYGTALTLASAQTNLIGFTVYNQALALVQTPQSPAPLGAQYMSVNYVMFGSGSRIAVAASAAVATALENVPVNTPVYWDYTNQVLLNAPGGTAIVAKVIDTMVGNCMVVSYNAGTGFATWNQNGSCVVIEI